MWLSNLFATRRELKRLAADNRSLRERVALLEQRNELLIQREFLIFDRMLTKFGGYAISDEAVHKSLVNSNDATKQYEDDKKAFLQMRYDELLQDAKDAGLPESHAEAAYKANEAMYLEQFESGGFFN